MLLLESIRGIKIFYPLNLSGLLKETEIAILILLELYSCTAVYNCMLSQCVTWLTTHNDVVIGYRTRPHTADLHTTGLQDT